MTMTIGGTSGLVFPDSSTQNTAATGFGFKNRIINGAMMIDQRNAGASVTPTQGQYSIDRWQCYLTQSGKYTVQQNAGSVTPPVGFKNYLGVTSTSAYSITSTDNFLITQKIEGYNIADFGWGTANASTVTLSFKVYSSLTGTFGGAVINASQNRSYPFTYTISSANTWTTATVTIAGDTSGTWATDNTNGLWLMFGLGVGSTNSATAGSWTGTSNIFSATGATSVVGTNGATFYITGVQLEKGSTATSFDYRPYGTELQLCQRYYYVNNANGNSGICYMPVIGDGYRQMLYTWPVPLRASPTVTATYSGGTNQGVQWPSYLSVNTYLNAGNNTSVYYLATITANAEL